MVENKNLTINFRQIPISLVLIISYLLSLWVIYLQIMSDQIELLATVFSVFLIVYPSLLAYNIIDEFSCENGSIVLKKKLKSYPLTNISSIRIIRLRFIGSVLLKVNLENRKSISGLYFYIPKEHEKFIDLIKRMNITYKVNKI